MMSLVGGVGLGAGGDFINISPEPARFAGCRMDETVQGVQGRSGPDWEAGRIVPRARATNA